MLWKLRFLIRRWRNAFAPAALHCIGDSHASFFSGEERMQPSWPRRSRDRIRGLRGYRVGPALAYNLVREGTTTRGRERVREILSTLPHGSHVMLCFGEIDCRAHLSRQAARQDRPVGELVDDCVERYLAAGAEIAAMGFAVSYWQVPPPSLHAEPGGEFPIEGSFEQRLAITRAFNQTLASGAARHGHGMISVFDHLTDASGTPLPHYFLDGIHLSQHAMPVALAALREAFPDLDLPPGPPPATALPTRSPS